MKRLPEINRRIGAMIKLLRKRRKLTQRELAEKAHISQSEVSCIEIGERGKTLEVLDKVTEALDISLSDLIWHAERPSIEDVLKSASELADELEKRPVSKVYNHA